jgi:hypothetical protein
MGKRSNKQAGAQSELLWRVKLKRRGFTNMRILFWYSSKVPIKCSVLWKEPASAYVGINAARAPSLATINEERLR